MGAVLNSIIPKAGSGGNHNQGWHGPSYYSMNPSQRPPSNPHPGGATQAQGLGNAFMEGPVDRGTQNTMNQFGQRLDRMGLNPAQGLGVQPGQGNAFNPFAGLFGGGQQGGQSGGFNPFQFLGGL